jgi:ligand-binding sensor domain-containing protein/signal transduction histidine kinase
MWLLGLIFTLSVLSARAERLPVKTYTTADGLAHDRVRRIVRDSRGYLWFCTAQGLSRFDSYSFTNYGTRHGLPHQSVGDLLETQDGMYWAATDNGLARFDPSANAYGEGQMLFTAHNVGEGNQNNVNVLYQTRAGQIYAGTVGGLFLLEQANSKITFRRLDLGDLQAGSKGQVLAFHEDREGSLWIGTSRGIGRLLPGGQIVRYSFGLGSDPQLVRSLFQDTDGRLWAGYLNGVLAFIPEPLPLVMTGTSSSMRTLAEGKQCFASDGRLRLPTAPGEACRYDHLFNRAVRDMHQFGDGRVWFGTNLGISEFDGERYQKDSSDDALNYYAVNSMERDIAGNLWLGTDAGGAMRIARNGFVSYKERDGLASMWMRRLFEDAAGSLCVMFNGRIAFACLDGGRFNNFYPNVPEAVALASRYFTHDTIQDRLSEWWVGTAKGLYRFARVADPKQLQQVRPVITYTTREGLANDDVFSLYEDSRGDLWIAHTLVGREVLTKWERASNQFRRYSFEEVGLRAPNAARAFTEDASGNVWVGFDEGGLVRAGPLGFAAFTKEDGLPAGGIVGLFRDRHNRIWVASDTSGAARIDDASAERPVFQRLTTADGLASDTTYCFTEDDWGRIYIGTANGVVRFNPQTSQLKHYSTIDGLSNNEVSCAYRDRHGALWFGTLEGLSRFVPEPDVQTAPPPIWITDLRVAGVRQPVSELGASEVPPLELSANQNNLEVNFNSLSFGTGGAPRYQYMLEGADRAWSVLTNARTVTYANLQPGTYRFLVRAVNADGMTSERAASLQFKIFPPLWQRWWFLTLIVVLVAAATYQLYRYRIRRLLELERLRTRIATDLHDDMGSSLSQISVLSEVVSRRVGREPDVAEPLKIIGGLSRELVDSMSDIVWAINPRRDRLGDLTQRMRRFASDVFTARDIEFRFDAPAIARDIKLGPEVRREVFLIFKEAVNNAARHSGCKLVAVEFAVRDNHLVLKIIDDGRGFDTAYTGDGDGNGLFNMRERAVRLGGSLEITSGNGDGTALILKVPLEGRGWL